MEMGEEHKETTEMAITNIRQHDILLGTNWFRAHNPQIDWAQNKLHFDHCPTSCYPTYPDETSILAQLLPTEALEAHYNDLLESKYHGQYDDLQQCELVVLPMMSPFQQSIVVPQHNMAKYELVVMPMVSIT